MPKARHAAAVEDMRPQYDFSNAVRGRYYKSYSASSNVVVLDRDVSSVFPNATAVNDALRALVSVARARVLVAKRGSGSAGKPKKSHRQ